MNQGIVTLLMMLFTIPIFAIVLMILIRILKKLK